jgi:hypothetical protein
MIVGVDVDEEAGGRGPFRRQPRIDAVEPRGAFVAGNGIGGEVPFPGADAPRGFERHPQPFGAAAFGHDMAERG